LQTVSRCERRVGRIGAHSRGSRLRRRDWKNLSAFTYEEQAESLHIISGLDSCCEVSATAPGAIALLLSGRPGDPVKPVSDLGKLSSGPGKGHAMQTWICTPPSGWSTGLSSCVPMPNSSGQKPSQSTDDKYICQGLSLADCWTKDLSTVVPKSGGGAGGNLDNITSKTPPACTPAVRSSPAAPAASLLSKSCGITHESVGRDDWRCRRVKWLFRGRMTSRSNAGDSAALQADPVEGRTYDRVRHRRTVKDTRL
jgi:hypothetical protein